jgi:hypothetical protein
MSEMERTRPRGRNKKERTSDETVIHIKLGRRRGTDRRHPTTNGLPWGIDCYRKIGLRAGGLRGKKRGLQNIN